MASRRAQGRGGRLAWHAVLSSAVKVTDTVRRVHLLPPYVSFRASAPYSFLFSSFLIYHSPCRTPFPSILFLFAANCRLQANTAWATPGQVPAALLHKSQALLLQNSKRKQMLWSKHLCAYQWLVSYKGNGKQHAGIHLFMTETQRK
jgi:hypothetical protein